VNDIFWIKGNPPAPLAIVLRPRGDEWLEDELLGMRRGGIQTLVSLLEEDEAVLLGLADEAPIAEHVGLKFLSYPIPDTEIPPNITAFQTFAAGLANRLRAGEQIGVHCRGSIGRATVTAACALIHLGWSPHAALAAIQVARGCMVPDTQEQEDWILRYKARP
jgi:protein-tyrosine phosphatase